MPELITEPPAPSARYDEPHRFSVRAFAAVALFGLGTLVIAGWVANTPRLVQIHPSWVPMQFNTALCFALLGLATLSVGLRSGAGHLCHSFSLALAGGIGALTLVEYALRVDLGIDELVMRHYISVETSHPGRMAPNTALEFVLSALTIIAVRKRMFAIGAALACVMLALALVPLGGYFLGLEGAYGWGRLTRMAAHTACGFVLFGGAIAIDVWRRSMKDREVFPAWGPIPVTLAGMVATSLLFQALVQEQRRELDRRVTVTTTAVSRGLGANLTQFVRALERLDHRLARSASGPRWFADASEYIEDIPGVRWIATADAAGEIRWQVGDPTVVPADIERRIAKSALETGGALRILDGDRSAALALAHLGRGRGSATVALIDPGQFLERSLGWSAGANFEFTVSHGDSQILSTASAPNPGASGAAASIPGTDWTLVGRLSGSANEYGWVPRMLLVAGITLSLLLGLVLWLFQRSSRNAGVLAEEVKERLRAERGLARSVDELNASNRDLSDFAHVVSHDLKAPLRAIGSVAEWMDEECSSQLDENGRNYLDLIRSRTARMDRLIGGILTYTKVSREDVQHGRVDTQRIVGEVAASLEWDAGVEFRIEGPLPSVDFNETQLTQVFQNLISNAARHTPAPGSVRVECEDLGDRWEFAVADTGPGIPEDHQKRIFEMFQTLQPRDQVDTTGIGLTLVDRIITRRGGTVHVSSTPGEGARFAFRIPKAPKPALPSSPTDSGPRPHPVSQPSLQPNPELGDSPDERLARSNPSPPCPTARSHS